MPVDIFVDKPPLTTQKASIGAVFNKVPVQQAKFLLNKINDLQSHRLSRKKFSNSFLPT
jgi:hypothetical protein